MNNIFEHFGKMKVDLETGPIAIIIGHWRKLVIRRKAERKAAEEAAAEAERNKNTKKVVKN